MRKMIFITSWFIETVLNVNCFSVALIPDLTKEPILHFLILNLYLKQVTTVIKHAEKFLAESAERSR